MKYLVLLFALLLGSCASHRKTARPAPVASQPVTPPAQQPEGITVQPPRTILDKLTGRTPDLQYYPLGTPVYTGKRSNVTVNNNHVAGNQSNQTNTAGKNATAGTGATGGKSEGPVAGAGATSTNVEKAKAPVATSSGDATDQTGTGAASTIKGNNNAPVLTNTQQEAPDWKASLATAFASPVGKLAALLLLLSVGYGVYRFWPALRRKDSPDTTV